MGMDLLLLRHLGLHLVHRLDLDWLRFSGKASQNFKGYEFEISFDFSGLTFAGLNGATPKDVVQCPSPFVIRLYLEV